MGERKGCGCTTISVVMLVLLFAGAISTIFNKSSERLKSSSNTQEAQSFPETPPLQPGKTAAELLQEAQKALNDKSESRPYGRLFDAEIGLKDIKPQDKEYAEAQKILKHITDCYKKLDQAIVKNKPNKQSGDVLAGLSSAEEAGLRLLALQSKGYIRLHIGEPSTFIEVEPMAWKSMMHQDKEKMCRLAQAFVTGLNQQQGKKIHFILFKDMTSRTTLAEVSLRDGNVSINK